MMMSGEIQKDRWDRVVFWAVPLLNFLQGDSEEPLHPADIHPYRDHAFYDGDKPEQTREEFVLKHMQKMALLPANQRRSVEEYYRHHGVREIS
jgi:hypothetical protein